jgi:secondary thiamine-phosphate synthase enzyme
MKRLTVRTQKRCELVDITDEVASAVQKSGVTDGVLLIYCPHTTAGITINETTVTWKGTPMDI